MKFGKFSAFLCIMGVLVLTTSSGATTLSWTDDGTYAPSGQPGENPITYTLYYNQKDTVGLEFEAVFTIEMFLFHHKSYIMHRI